MIKLAKLGIGWRPYGLLAILTMVFWLRTLTFDLVWDDRFFIEQLDSIRSLRNLPAMFYSLAAQSSYPEGFVLFRPLRTAHYAILFALGGGEPPKPWLFHLANILWHAAVAVLLLAVLRRILARLTAAEPVSPWPAFLVALGFAVHPVVTEVVAWAKSLDDLMAAAFTLLSAWCLLAHKLDRRLLAGALGAFVLAVYSKISAVPLVAVAFLILWLVRREKLFRSLKITSGFALIALVFIVHHHWVIGRTSQTAPISGSYGQTLVDMFPTVVKYLRLLCGIPPFFIDYSFMPGGHGLDMEVIAGLTLLVASLALMFFGWRKAGWWPVGLGLAWLLLFMLPVSNLMPMMQYMAERFLYLPMIGWCVVLAWWLSRHWQRTLVRAGALAVLFFWAVLSWNRAAIWEDEITLFVSSSRQGPHIARVEDNAVAAVFRQPHFRTVFQVENLPGALPRFTLAEPSAQAHADWQRILGSLAELERLYPENASLLTAQGLTYALRQNPARAGEYFGRVTRLHPKDASAWNNLGQAAFADKNLAQANAAFEQALALDSRNLPALKSMSALKWQQADYRSALDYLLRLQTLEPKNPDHPTWIKAAQQRLANP